MQYYGNRLSENITRREPEGYLFCLNVPVARTGTQEYLPEELGLVPGSFSLPPGGMISVLRPEEEVFAPETLASFEGMPVTNDHPADGVDVENIRRVQMGHAHNIRRGSGDEADLLLADLVITDGRLIDAILKGKREISCGYTYELTEENGQYVQRKIRGNHIAVVNAGRAGPRVSIKDRKCNRQEEAAAGQACNPAAGPDCSTEKERSNKRMKKSLTKLLARMAKDGDVETVAEFIEEMIGEEAETPAEIMAEAAGEAAAEAVAAEEPVTVEVPEHHEVTIDEESIAGIIERLDRLIELLGAAPAGDEEPEAENNAETEAVAQEIAAVMGEVIENVQNGENGADPFEGRSSGLPADVEVGEVMESILAPAVSTTVEENGENDEECDDPEDAVAQDALRAALMAVRPVLSTMNRKQRRKVCADIASRLNHPRKGSDIGPYAALARLGQRRETNNRDLGKRIMAARNPNYRSR